MHKPLRPNSRPLSAEKQKELKHKASLILSDLRRQLLYRYPFCGTVSMSLELVPTRDPLITTAACDGKHVYFDIDFLSKLSPEHQLFVFAHEVWHAILCHMLRSEGRDHEAWNIAADMEVNALLRVDGLSVPPSALLPEQYGFSRDETHNAETYYEAVIKQNKQSQNRAGGSGGQKEQGDSKGGGSGASQLGGDPNGEMVGQFDQHLSESDNLAGMPRPEAEDKYGKLEADPDLQPQVTKQNVEMIREAAVSAAQQIERSRGELPAHLKRLVNELIKPEMPWQELMQQFVTRCMGEKTTWSRPHRRFVASGTYLPSHYGEMLKIAVGLDTSGSTSGDMVKFLSELNGIVQTFGNYELYIIECDARVGKFEKFDESRPLDLENDKWTSTGGGGTRLQPIFDKINEEQLDIDAALIFTDGYTEHFTRDMAPEYPVMWLLTTHDQDKNFEFGETVHFKK